MNTASAARLVALRLDDVGASSKRYEVYSNRTWQTGPLRVSGNWLFLKYLPGVKQWGPYRELRADEWHQVFEMLRRASARLTVAVTATWAVRADRLIPFPERFPAQAEALREGVREGLIEVANHGLTHCVLEGNRFRPRWMSSNRAYHREFLDWVPPAVHEDHLRRSQDILKEYFQVPVVTFVPPGNVYTRDTLMLAERYGLRYVSCDATPGDVGRMRVLGNDRTIPFHDRDLVVNGIDWLRNLLARDDGARYCSVADLATGGATSAPVPHES